MTYNAGVVKSGISCSVTIPAGTSVIMVDDGELVTDTTKTLQVVVGGTALCGTTSTLPSSGIGTVGSPITVSGPCGGGSLSYSFQ